MTQMSHANIHCVGKGRPLNATSPMHNLAIQDAVTGFLGQSCQKPPSRTTQCCLAFWIEHWTSKTTKCMSWCHVATSITKWKQASGYLRCSFPCQRRLTVDCRQRIVPRSLATQFGGDEQGDEAAQQHQNHRREWKNLFQPLFGLQLPNMSVRFLQENLRDHYSRAMCLSSQFSTVSSPQREHPPRD